MRSRIQNLLTALGLISTLIGCATDEAARLREEKTISVGLLGGAYRPNNHLTVGADGNALPTGGAGGFAGFLEQVDRKTTTSGFQLDVYGVHHIWETSAFYVGGGLRIANGTVSFNAKDAAGDFNVPVRYKRNDVYLTVPVGWYWIWDPGFTLGLDFGPNLRVVNSWKLDEAGAAGVNADDRDKFADDLDSSNGFVLGGRGIIGWSF